MKPTKFDAFVVGDTSRVLETFDHLLDAMEFARAQEGLDIVIVDRRRLWKSGRMFKRSWTLYADGSVSKGEF